MTDTLLGWRQIGASKWALYVPPNVTVEHKVEYSIRVLLKTLRALAKDSPRLGCAQEEEEIFCEKLYRTSAQLKTWAELLSLPGSPSRFSHDTAVWVHVSERHYATQRMLDLKDALPMPFRAVPLFEPSENISTAQAVNAATFSRSRACGEILLFQLGAYDKWNKNAFNHIHLETQAQVLGMLEKVTEKREPPKRGVHKASIDLSERSIQTRSRTKTSEVTDSQKV